MSEDINVGGVLEALNGKVDIDLGNCPIVANTDASNFTTTGRETVVGWGMPDYSASSTITFTVGQTYTVPYDCELYFVQASDTAGGVCKLRLNDSSGTVVFYCGSSTYITVSSDRARFKKGTVLYVERCAGTWFSNIITPLIGVN